LVTGKVGSGKSTLGEILADITKPDAGTVSWTGGPRVMLLQDVWYHISTLTVRDEAASWHGDGAAVIQRAGLVGKEDQDLLTLSRGEIRRLELAAILTGAYDLIILDEPWAGLDETARAHIRHLITHHGDGIIVIISHDITNLPPIDMLWEMDAGTLTLIGHVPECLGSWKRAPALITHLINHGACPRNLSREALLEALCRIHG